MSGLDEPGGPPVPTGAPAADTSLARLAESMAADLLASVIEDSRQAAGRLLQERLTAALVARAEELAGARSEPAGARHGPAGASRPVEPQPDRPAPREALETPGPAPTCDDDPIAGWYVYGLTDPHAGPPERPGLDGAAVTAIERAGVAALVSPLPQSLLGGPDPAAPGGAPWGRGDGGEIDLDSLAPRLRDHQRVLEGALEHSAVLPFRFGVMYRDRYDIEEMLASHADRVLAQLDRLRGRAEWGVTVRRPVEPAAPAAACETRPRSGRGYLAQRREERAESVRHEEQAAAAAAALHARLADRSDGAVLHRPERADRSCLMRASYLVRWDTAREFRHYAGQLLRAAPPHLHLEGELTGPWPAYHFVDERLTGPVGSDRAEAPLVSP